MGSKPIEVNKEYLDLITSEYANKEKFYDYVRVFLYMLNATVDNLKNFDSLFNIEIAQADQLDKIGQLLNVSRYLPIVNENIDSELDDDTYRKVLKSRILMNHWDGTRKGLENIFKIVFPDVSVDLSDNQDMSYDVRIIDPEFSDSDLALLQNGYILPKSSGVRVNYEILYEPLFGWELDSNYVKGWEKGKWSTN